MTNRKIRRGKLVRLLGCPAPEGRAEAVRHGREMTNDFHLWGSRRWRRMGEYSTETRLFTEMVHTFDNYNASLSEGGAFSVVVGDFHETP